MDNQQGEADTPPKYAGDGDVKPKLLFISRKWPPAVGGMETFAAETAATLAQGFDITKLVLPGRPGGRTPSLLGYGWFIVKACVYCLARARRFDYLFLSDLLMFPAALCSRAVRKHQRRIVVVYGLDLIYGRRRGLLPAVYEIYFRCFRACQHIFNHIVAISTYTAGVATERGLAGVAIINPALRERVAPATAATNLPPVFGRATQTILQFGRLVPRKGALWFARSVLPQLPDDIEFVVAGPPTDAGYCASLQACPRTTYLGVVPDDVLTSMIKTADVVIMPNIPMWDGRMDIEGFGLVATETTAHGGILVASRFQGITDAVVDGVTGTLVPPADAAAWHHALVALLGETASQRATRRHEVELETHRLYSRERVGTAYTRLLIGSGIAHGLAS